jgi:hypothetical protein
LLKFRKKRNAFKEKKAEAGKKPRHKKTKQKRAKYPHFPIKQYSSIRAAETLPNGDHCHRLKKFRFLSSRPLDTIRNISSAAKKGMVKNAEISPIN